MSQQATKKGSMFDAKVRQAYLSTPEFIKRVAARSALIAANAPRTTGYWPDADLPTTAKIIGWTIRPMGGKDGRPAFGDTYVLGMEVTDERHPGYGEKFNWYIDVPLPKPGVTEESKLYRRGVVCMRKLLRTVVPLNDDGSDPTANEKAWAGWLNEIVVECSHPENPLIFKVIPREQAGRAYKNAKGEEQKGRIEKWLDVMGIYEGVPEQVATPDDAVVDADVDGDEGEDGEDIGVEDAGQSLPPVAPAPRTSRRRAAAGA